MPSELMVKQRLKHLKKPPEMPIHISMIKPKQRLNASLDRIERVDDSFGNRQMYSFVPSHIPFPKKKHFELKRTSSQQQLVSSHVVP